MERATERAFRRAGHDTLLIDDRRAKRLLGLKLTQRWALFNAARYRPDFILLSKCLALDPETVSEIIADKPNAMWYHDPQWYRETNRPDIGHIATIGKLSQTFFVSGFDAEWRALGLPAKYLPAAADRAIMPVTPNPRFASDVTFIGTGYDPARSEILLEVAKKQNVRVWGLGWEKWREPLRWTGKPVEGKQFAAVCSSSKVTLGINPAIAKGGSNYTSDRTWMVMLAGAFYLGQGTPGMREMLHDGVHCGWYEDAADCVAQCDRYLRDARERERIRVAGEHFVRANHTYDQRITSLLSGEAWTNPIGRA